MNYEQQVDQIIKDNDLIPVAVAYKLYKALNQITTAYKFATDIEEDVFIKISNKALQEYQSYREAK